MAHTSHFLLILFIITFFLISFYSTNGIHKVERFRVLLGLSNNADFPFAFSHPSPGPAHSPAPAPSGATAPAPVVHMHHRHAQPPLHHHHPLPRAHKIERRDHGARVLISVLASVGIASVLCAIGLFFGCLRFKKQGRKQRRNKGGVSKFITATQSSVKKVTSDPGPDLFYLNSLESALEPEKCCLRLNTSIDEREGSLREITSVHEISEPNSSFGERIIPEEIQRFDDKESDDESFHSICDSHSSQCRLSDASSHDEIKVTQCSTAAPPPPPPPPPPPLNPSSMVKKPNFVKKPTLPNLTSGSSPAPPAAAGVPQPPRPPPLSNGAPPPPPGLLTQQIPLGKDGSPLPKLKPLHWDKVRAAPNRSTVWDKLRSSSFEFDEEMIESLFGYNLQNSMKNDEVMKSKTPSPSKHVLEPKRLQNITILSKALNVTEEQVCGALIRGEGLSLQDLEALSKMVPTKEEEGKLASYKGDIFELGSAEKLVKAMLQVPFAFSRIEAMLYRETFEDEVVHLRRSFSMLEEACKELRSSRLFLKLLEAVLKTGNRMNIGTIRGGAKAFKLDALLKLADVKGTDGKTTLLHFVVQEIIRSEGIRVSESIMGKIQQRTESSNNEDKEESYRRMGLDLVSGLSSELCNAKKTASIDLDVLASSVANLSEGLHKVQSLVQKEMNGGFVNAMRSFLKHAETKMVEVEEDERRVMWHVKEITEYFHGDVSKDESNRLRIFVIVRDFLSMLDHVCKELRSSKVPRCPNPLSPFT